MLQGLLDIDAAIHATPAGSNITYIGTAEASGTGGTGTFTNQNIGTASADRLVVLLLSGTRSIQPSRTLSTLTIGGNAAAVHASVTNVNGTEAPLLTIASLVVAAGTTADIVATYSGALTEVVLSVYTITGLISTTPVTGSNAVASGDPSTTANVTGIGVAVALWQGSSGTRAAATFTGVAIKDYDADVTGLASSRVAFGHEGALATETPRTFSATSTMTVETIIAATWH